MLILFRVASRSGKERVLKFQNGKVFCECKDDRFIGVPCRHMIALANKESSIQCHHLPINLRWKINDFEGNQIEEEPELLPQINSAETKTNKVFFNLKHY